MMNPRSTRLAVFALFLSLMVSTGAFAQGAETLILFDPTPPPETPESIVFDR